MGRGKEILPFRGSSSCKLFEGGGIGVVSNMTTLDAGPSLPILRRTFVSTCPLGRPPWYGSLTNGPR